MRTICFLLAWALSVTGFALADELTLTNGDVISGTYVGGDARVVRFIGPTGKVETYFVSELSAIRFVTSLGVPPAAAPSPAARSTTNVTVPAGTVITVRLIDAIDADLTGIGERFRASIDDPVTVGGRIVIPRYADATVQVMRVSQSGAVKGSDELALKLYDITVGGRAYSIATNYAELKGKGKGRKTARNAVIGSVGGAVLGGILGGGKGAAIGAAAGAGTGVAVAAARGTKLHISSESRLRFVLRAPLGL